MSETEPIRPDTAAADQTIPPPDGPTPGLPVVHLEPAAPAVDPARAAAGRRGGERFHQLVQLGRQYEREHGLKPGRQRLKQLVQLGRRYEQEHGLAPKPRRRRRAGDPWREFLATLARVVKPTHRPAVEQLLAALQPPRTAA